MKNGTLKSYLRGFIQSASVVTLLSNVLTLPALGNAIGTDMQNFNPSADGLDFVTVHSSETLEPGFMNFGLFVNYAVNSLPYFEDDSAIQNRTIVNDTLWSADINFAVGLMPNWEAGISFPQLLSQSVQYRGYSGRFSDNGSTEVRVMTKYRFWGDASQGVATIGSINFNNVQNNPYVGKSNNPIYNIEFAGDMTVLGNLALGLNVGYRYRQPGDALDDSYPIVPVQSQYIASAAASYHIPQLDSKIILEVFGSQPVNNQQNYASRLASSAEATLGIKWDITNNVAAHAGGGTALAHGQASPDWRAYAGVNYQIGPTWTKENRTTPVAPAFDQPPQNVEKYVVHDILFQFDSDHIVLPNTKGMLEKLAARAKEGKGYKHIEIVGHTDSVGRVEYNQDLSQRRAETVKQWLVDKHGFDPNTISVVGKGQSEPIADNGNYQGRQLNRRVEFNITRE